MDFMSKTRVCFILGIDQRSGTHFLFNLLKEHPSCVGPGPIWEDHFLRHSKILKWYTDSLYKSWTPSWEVEKKLGGQETLLRQFGDAIVRFLRLQLTQDPVNQTTSKQDFTEFDVPKILLTKTPSVEGLDNFFDLFPDAYLILLVRDGRSVVESGVRSFNWNYENAMWKWRNRAQIILDFKEKYESENRRFVIIKYEDLVTDEKINLLKIFNYLDIDGKLFDFESAKSVGVIGSSELMKQTGKIHWEKTEKKSHFNPLERFANWDIKKHERFNWIAGQQMMKFGYKLNTNNCNRKLYVIKNRFMDLRMTIKVTYLKIARSALKLARKLA